MGLKSYIISTILLIIVLFGFVHSLELGEYTLSLFGFSETLPVSVWFVLPIIFLSLLKRYTWQKYFQISKPLPVLK